MASWTKTLKVRLQENGFCIATGPHDSGIRYPCLVKPFAPVIIESPVVLHLHCPGLFPDKVLKIHAEHLGHFLALQNVPQISQEYESVLFQGLCRLFTRTRVIKLYQNNLKFGKENDMNMCQSSHDQSNSQKPQPEFYQKVFRTGRINQDRARKTVSLIHELLELFNLKQLTDGVVYVPGEEPQHMLFLYLIQILVIYVSSFIPEKDLATIMSVASAPFLEANFCDPLCAATILKPMFLPYCNIKGLKYILFKGYEIDNTGSNVSKEDHGFSWSYPSLLNHMQGPKVREKGQNILWFTAPQFDDRMDMVSQHGHKLMGGQTGEKPLKICEYLISDNLLAYLQCAVFGTINNMLPCHANSEFTEDVMSTIDYSMTRFAEELDRKSSNLIKEQHSLTENCLHIAGVGFASQEKGNKLLYGKVFTGPEGKRPSMDQNQLGVFISVMLGLADRTLVSKMINAALVTSSDSNQLKEILSTPNKAVAIERIISDMYFFARYHNMFNAGEFTEICCVKPMNDPKYKAKIHQDSLKKDSKYQLTVINGALPMCTLTLVMTIRQAVIMVMGLICAELARTIYKLKAANHDALCKAITSLNMPAKFWNRDEENVNVFHAQYGDSLKLTGPAFSNPGKAGIDYDELNRMEWLQESDTTLPTYITNALNKIGDVKAAVMRIMQEHNLRYNRVLFMGPFSKLSFSTFFANPDFMIHTPIMAYSSLKIFASDNAYGGVRLSRVDSYYPVKVFSNSSINTKLYNNRIEPIIDLNATPMEMYEMIKDHAQGVCATIHMNRIRYMASELSQDQLKKLVLKLENEGNVTVLGQGNFDIFQPCEPGPSSKRELEDVSCNDYQELDKDDDAQKLSSSWKCPRLTSWVPETVSQSDDGLTICQPDMDSPFDN